MLFKELFCSYLLVLFFLLFNFFLSVFEVLQLFALLFQTSFNFGLLFFEFTLFFHLTGIFLINLLLELLSKCDLLLLLSLPLVCIDILEVVHGAGDGRPRVLVGAGKRLALGQ